MRSSAPVVWFVMFISKSACLQFDMNEMVRDVASKLCPITKFCYSPTKTMRKQSNTPCCSPCSCKDDCWETGNCCPDKENITYRSPILPCKVTIIQRSNHGSETLYDGFNYGIKRYRIVDSCPEQETNLTLIEKCENKAKLDEMLWVSDNATGKIFQNIYCATCNSVKEVIKWQVRTRCFNVLSANFSTGIKDLFETCQFINEIPATEKSVGDQYLCYIPSIMKCNQTGLWRDYDEKIEQACNKLTLPFIQTKSFFGVAIIYNNVFCYICNQHDNSMVRKYCPREKLTRTNSVTFSALLNIEKYLQSTEQIHKVSECDNDQVKDIFTNQCRQLSCSIGSAPFHGKCEPLAFQMDGLGIVVFYNLQILEVPSIRQYNQQNHFSVGEGINTKFQEVLGLQKARCGLCGNALRIYNSSNLLSGLIMVSAFHTNSDCQFDFILNKFTQVHGKQFSVMVKQIGTFVLNVTIEKQPLNFVSMDVMYASSNTKVCHSLRLTSDKNCPQVQLNYSEAVFLSTKREKSAFVSLFENGTEDQLTQVCVEDYFRIMTMMSTNRAVKSNFLHLIITYFVCFQCWKDC